MGGLIFSYVSCLLVNPNNLGQTTDAGMVSFDDSVTLAVPHMLRILAICFIGIVLLAVLLIREP